MSEGQPQQVQLQIERMYLKDASFEAPGAPAIFAEQGQPGLQLDLHTQVNKLDATRHEVVLAATVTARLAEDKVAYIVEAHQAGVFNVQGAQGEQLRAVLSIGCANLLFPYLREALDNLVMKGGFAALQLAPVNFEAMYQQAMQNQAKQQSETDDQIKH